MIKSSLKDYTIYKFRNIATPHLLSGKPLNIHRETGTINRDLLGKFLNGKDQKIIFPDQKHTANVAVVSDQTLGDAFPETDAIISDLPGIMLGVVTADCVPLLIHDPVKRAVGAVHAGWRGTRSRIVERAIQAMEQQFYSNPGDLKVGIGPSISGEVYEVDKEVYQAYAKNEHDVDLFFAKQSKGKYLLDLWQANYQQLINSGVPKHSIELSNLCTFTLNHDFYSARRDGIHTGRNAAVIKND